MVAEQTPLNRMRDKREKMRRALAAIGGRPRVPGGWQRWCGGDRATEDERMKEREGRRGKGGVRGELICHRLTTQSSTFKFLTINQTHLKVNDPSYDG